MDEQPVSKNLGIAAVVVAVPLYAWSLLDSKPFEPLILLAAILLFAAGVFRLAHDFAAAPDWKEPFTVRLQGAGTPGSKERERWLHIQTQRGRSIRNVLLSVIIGALALFVENHVTGSVGCSPADQVARNKPGNQAGANPTLPEEKGTPETASTPGVSPTPAGTPAMQETAAPQETVTSEPASAPGASPTPGNTPATPAPQETLAPSGSPAPEATPGPSQPPPSKPATPKECEKGPLAWKSHADRMERGLIYETQEDDTFAKIALVREIPPSLLGPENLAVRFKADETMAKTLAVDSNSEVTIEWAAQQLQITAAQVATRFATATLPAGQELEIPADRPYDPRQWVDWLLWTLIGMAASLLIEVARHLRSIPDGEGDFLAETSWYWTQLATGPLIAFVILLLFVHIDVNLLTGDEAAVEVNLRDYPTDLLLVPAFLLGFYSRVTREVLDQLMRRIFGGAWRAANGDFEIVIKGQPGDGEVASTVKLETQPPAVVTWSTSAGKIDSSGLFEPPAVDSPAQVFVTAIAAGTNRAITRAISVVKHKFAIEALDNPSGEVQPGQEQELSLKPLPAQEQDKITWELVPSTANGFTLEGSPGPKAKLKVSESATPGETVTVKATYAGLARTISFKVKKPAAP